MTKRWIVILSPYQQKSSNIIDLRYLHNLKIFMLIKHNLCLLSNVNIQYMTTFFVPKAYSSSSKNKFYKLLSSMNNYMKFKNNNISYKKNSSKIKIIKH